MKDFGSKSIHFLDTLNKVRDLIQITSPENVFVPLKEALDQCGELLKRCHQKKRKLIFIGNGGSAAIASHQAIDYWKNGRIRAIAFNDSSLLTCIANDYGYDRVFVEPLKMFSEPEDILIAVSSSGKSQNIIQAVHMAQNLNLKVFTLSGFEASNPLRGMGDINFYIPSFNYGIVEVSHLSILHSLLDSLEIEHV